jgi:hypothetical protein
MAQRGWTALSATVALVSVLATAGSAWAQGTTMATITVRVDDRAGVQGALLTIAEGRAAQVFRMSGVQVNWIDGEVANRLKIVAPYTVLIMAEAPAKLKAEAERLGADVIGQGAPFIGRAYIYYDRVVAFRPIPPRDLPTTLGDVMAHELGHLILPPGHSNVGIMRPTVNMRSRRVETFTEDEAAAIQNVLSEREQRTTNAEPRTTNAEPNLNTN